jgi:hypothetical protein
VVGGSRGLASRARIGRRGVRRIVLGSTRRELLRRVAVAPAQRKRVAFRYCVRGSTAQLTAVFSGRSRRAGVELVLTTAPGYARRHVHTGSRAAAFRRAFPNRRALGSGLFLASPRSRILFWVTKGRVRFVAVVSRRVQHHPRRFTHDLRVALG